VRRAALLIALVSLGAGACGGSGKPAVANQAVHGDSITLTQGPRKVGETWTEDKSQAMDISIDVQGQKVPMVGGEHEVKKIEVLAVDGKAITKARMTYVTWDRSQRMNGQEQAKPSPLVGKSYILEAGTPITVTSDAGTPTQEEIDAVRDAEKRFGKTDGMDKVLDGRTFTKDEPLVFDPAEVAAAMGDDDGTVIKAMTMTYRGLEGSLALFDMAMTVEQPAGGATMTIDMTGNAKVEPTSNDLVEMALQGTLTATGAFTASGTMQTTETHTR
jgi:hypothetical protein